MARNLNRVVDTMTYDGLISGIEPAAKVEGATIAALLAEATLARGTVMAKNAAGKLIVLGSDVDKTGTFSATGDGSTKKFIPHGSVIVTAPACGRMAYGSITQIEEYTRDYVTYPGRRVPHVTTDSHANTRVLTLQAKPLAIPNVKNPFIYSKVLA